MSADEKQLAPSATDQQSEVYRESPQTEYLTVADTASLLRVSPKRVMNMMCAGVFVEGVHFFRPRGLRPRFKASAVRDYIEGRDQPQQTNVIQLRKGSVLRIPMARS